MHHGQQSYVKSVKCDKPFLRPESWTELITKNKSIKISIARYSSRTNVQHVGFLRPYIAARILRQ